jgi:hypothetical protein
MVSEVYQRRHHRQPFVILERAKTAHAAHPARDLTPEWIAEFDRPMGLGDVVEVDTSQPVDVSAIAVHVAALLDQSS